MTLLYFALSLMAGVLLAQAVGGRALPECGLTGWASGLWASPALLLPLLPRVDEWLARRFPPPMQVLRWPQSAGFVAPSRRPSAALIGACLLAAAMGALLLAGRPLTPCWTPRNLAYYNQPAEKAFAADVPAMAITGWVSSYVSAGATRPRISVRARTLDAGTGAMPVSGQLTLLTNGQPGLVYGAPVRLYGVVSTPPDFADFSYREYLARRGVHSQMARASVRVEAGDPGGNPLLRALFSVRSRGELLINRLLAEPYAALANGMLLGVESSIPDELMAQFNDTSTSHVIVISGSNVALIAGVLLSIGARLFGRRGALWWTVGGISLYALLVGAEPSVVRAAVMGSLVVIAAFWGRRSTALASLGAACLAMVVWNPLVLWDVGFQLSAAATAGIVLFAPRLLSLVRPASVSGAIPAAPTTLQRWAGLPAETLAMTLAASLAVQPLITMHFQRISLVGLLSNLLIVPVQPLILLAGAGALVVGLMGLLPLAQLLFWCAWLGLAWTVAVVELSAGVRWASIAVGDMSLPVMFLYYGLLAALFWPVRKVPAVAAGGSAPSLKMRAAHLLGARYTLFGLALGCALIWLGVRAMPDGRLHVYLLPAERGSAVLVRTPAGNTLLVNGGDDGQRLLTQIGGVLPFWQRSLNLVALSHGDKRTAAAQLVLPARLRVDRALAPAGGDETVQAWERALLDAGVQVDSLSAGDWVDLGDGAALWVLAPVPGEKEGSLLLRLVYGDFLLLLPAEAQRLESAAAVDATALVIPGTGDAPQALADQVNSALTIVYAEETITDSGQVRYPATGAIHLVSDGNAWWVEE